MNYEMVRLNAPMSWNERESADEVFTQYPGLDLLEAWQALVLRARDTSRPFKAYDCAHAVACSQFCTPSEEETTPGT
jgi:hypothetical protein